MLDQTSWVARSYSEETGPVELVRHAEGRPEPESVPSLDTDDDAYVDQHSAEPLQAPTKVDVGGQAYLRDRQIRDQALRRAAGRCEFCNAPGFRTTSGKLYLETHHVVPLSQGGSDDVRNIAALCANDHREAHYGERASTIRTELLAMLDGA